jgi:hypothetical protein
MTTKLFRDPTEQGGGWLDGTAPDLWSQFSPQLPNGESPLGAQHVVRLMKLIFWIAKIMCFGTSNDRQNHVILDRQNHMWFV